MWPLWDPASSVLKLLRFVPEARAHPVPRSCHPTWQPVGNRVHVQGGKGNISGPYPLPRGPLTETRRGTESEEEEICPEKNSQAINEILPASWWQGSPSPTEAPEHFLSGLGQGWPGCWWRPAPARAGYSDHTRGHTQGEERSISDQWLGGGGR